MKKVVHWVMVVMSLCGCSSPDDQLKKAQELLDQARTILEQNGERGKAEKMLKEAMALSQEGRLAKTEGDKTPIYCAQRYLDGHSIELQMKSISYHQEISTLTTQEGLLDSYRNHRSDTFEMKRLDEKIKDCAAWHNISLMKKSTYETALKEHERLDEQLQRKFEKISGVVFSEKLYQVNKQKAEYARLQDWNQLSKSEKAEAAGFDREVQTCAETALGGSNAGEGIPSIVQDVTTLCARGLGK